MIRKIAVASAVVAALSATQVGAQGYGSAEQSVEDVDSSVQQNINEAERQAQQSQQQREEQERQLELQSEAEQDQLEKDEQQTNAIMSGDNS